MFSGRIKKANVIFAAKFLLIFCMQIAWIFSGWPQIFNFPPEVERAEAALVLGTSSGFVTVAPTGDPTGGNSTTIDGSSVVTKHTSPAGATKITQIGWYRNSGTNTANFEVALYAADGSSSAAGTRLFIDNTNSTSSNGWVTVTVDWDISSSTAYWLAVQMDAHSGSSAIDRQTSGGAGLDILTSQTTPATPYGGGSLSDADGMMAIYALVSVPPTVTTQAVSDIGTQTATGNGNVTADGGATVTERGVVANTTGTPTTSDLKFAAAAGGTGVFTASMTGLNSSTHYYVRAYAINSAGTSYGGQVEFDTDSANASPTLTVNQPDGTNDTVVEGASYNIDYDLADSDDVVTAAFYYDANDTGLDGIAISGPCATAAEGTGATCAWNTTGVTAGSYYVYGITDDGTNPAVSDYSSGTITINAQSLTFSLGSSSVNLGNLSTGSVSSGSHTLIVGTNAANGAVVTYSGATLTSNTDTIDVMSSATTSSPGSKQFGINAKDNATPNVGAECSGSAPIAAAATGYATADNFKFVSGETIVSSSESINDTTCTISYIANISAVTDAGSYTTTLTYIATGTF